MITASLPDNRRENSYLGLQLGDYTLLRLITDGGTSHIYEGEDPRLSRRAAVKVLDPDRLAADSTLSRRFLREARAAAGLEHSNIIRIYQFGEQAGIYFLAMQLVRGRDLSQELKRMRATGHRIAVPRVLHIMSQVAAALDYAHTHNLVHRDVKPSNILLDQGDHAILSDFGLVMMEAIDATQGTAFGTPRYMAPEQAVSSRHAVPQSDIYSLGVILYEALTGEPPFSGKNPLDLAMKHLRAVPRPPRELNSAIPPGVEAEILRALTKEPEERHATATEFMSAVQSYYTNPVVVTPDETASVVVSSGLVSLLRRIRG